MLPVLLPTILLFALIGSVTAASAAPRASSGAVPTLPVDSLRVGMVGIGYSVFQGTTIDTFSMTILGVLKGTRPGADLILARAHGPFLERTGIIAGMSGSPVYIRGKLIGAVSYSMGAFSKDPIAGITPIEEMLSSLHAPREGPSDSPEDRFGSLDILPGDASILPGQATPIATPLALAGFTSDALQYLEPWLKERGFVSGPGGGTLPGGSCDSIVPGAAVGVQLVSGDLSATAIGTATYREGDRVLAFGHPFFAMGNVQLPMTAVVIHTVLASQQFSSKMGSATRTCGTLVADRSVGVAGQMGAPPSMIPVSVSIRGTQGRQRRFNFKIARSKNLTPGLAAAVVVSSISEALFDAGVATARYNLAYSLNDGKQVLRQSNAVITPGPLAGVGDDVSQTLFLLMVNRFQDVKLDSLNAEVSIEEGIDQAALTSIRVSPTIAAPGDSVMVELSLRPARRPPETRRAMVRIPPGTPAGEITVRVCGAEETGRWEQERAPDAFVPHSFEQLLGLLERERRGDFMYVQLYRESLGATVKGAEISQAPPSLLEVLDAKDKSGNAMSTKGATLAEIPIGLGRVGIGCETKTITVVPYRAK